MACERLGILDTGVNLTSGFQNQQHNPYSISHTYISLGWVAQVYLATQRAINSLVDHTYAVFSSNKPSAVMRLKKKVNRGDTYKERKNKLCGLFRKLLKRF